MTNIEKIRQEIESKMRETDDSQFGIGGRCMCRIILAFIDTLPEEKPSEDFPTSNEEMAKFLATHPKIKVPEKYKNPDWLLKKQEQRPQLVDGTTSM